MPLMMNSVPNHLEMTQVEREMLFVGKRGSRNIADAFCSTSNLLCFVC